MSVAERLLELVNEIPSRVRDLRDEGSDRLAHITHVAETVEAESEDDLLAASERVNEARFAVVAFRSDQPLPQAIVDSRRRIRGIAKQGQVDLLELDPIAGDGPRGRRLRQSHFAQAMSWCWITSPTSTGVRMAIEAVGAQLRFLPPYSPDLNPIEAGERF